MDLRLCFRYAAFMPLLLCVPMMANAQGRTAGCTSEGVPPSEELRDQDSIAIYRSTCFGPCPSYTVTVHANGLVSWEGKANVTQTGNVSAQIPSDTARSVIENFRAAGFWTYVPNTTAW